MNSRVSIIIPYANNPHGLSALMMLCQMQTMKPNKIIILDNSKDGSGFEIAKRYKVNTETICEQNVGTIYQSWNEGMKLAGDDDVAILNDDVLIQPDFVEMMKMSNKNINGLVFVPDCPDRAWKADHVEEFDFTSNFHNYERVTWMPGFVFYLPRVTIDTIGMFDEQFNIWFGDTDYETRVNLHAAKTNGIGVIKLKGCYAYHYGGSSFGKVMNEEMKATIEQDRVRYVLKYQKKDEKKESN